MDASEKSVMLEVLNELRQLRAERARFADTMVLINHSCVRVIEAVERLDARVTLLAAAAE